MITIDTYETHSYSRCDSFKHIKNTYCIKNMTFILVKYNLKTVSK